MSDDSSRPSKPESDEASPSSEPVPNAGRDEVVDLDATLDPYATLQFDPNEGRMLERPRGDGIDDGTIVPQTDDASSPLRVGEVAPLSRGPLESGTRPDRFLKGKAHARGGLGEVFVALDAELNRQVALKQIQQQFATDEFSRRRFMFEAEITGRLEHPGIVPVYGMGLDARGEPYYAMRFIQGMSLERAIQDAHGKGGPTQRLWSGAAESYLDLRRLLSRFMDVCQTIGFAHSRNVIHRDIKPDNIMLGSYGETLVVDWGLARKLDPKTPSKSRKPGNSSQRMIEGTPAFMSPEQAVGDLDGITTASDVYSLGATLYCILTGHPAVMTTRHDGRRRSVHEVLEIVRKGDVPSPRQIDPSIPKSLEAICMRAMSHRPSERYQTAQQLAAEVERWMADEPVDAYRESWLQRSRRWIKRHQAMAASLLAIVMVSAMGLMIFSIVLRGKNTQLANLADSLSTKNQQLDQRSQELERSNQDLRVARNRADRKAAIATAVTEFLNKDVLAQASPLAQPEPDLKVRTVFSRAADALDVRFDTEPAVKAELLHTVGIAFRYLDQLDDAESSLREALSLQSDLPNADELAVRRTKLELASVLLARGKQSDVPDLLRSDFDRLSDSDESRPSADATEERLLLLTVLSEYYSVGERWDLAERFQLELIDLCKRMLGENHWATLEAQTSHANILIETGRFDAALRLAREVSQRSRQHLGPNHMITLGAELALAQRLYYSQQTDEAFEIYKRVLESCQRTLGEEHAYTLYVRNDLAMLQSGSGNSAGALETLQKVHELTLDKYGPNHRENLVGALNLASVMLDMDSGDEAVALIRDVMSRSRQSLGDDHSVTGYARTCLAEYHFREGELDEAEALLRENIDQDFRERIDGRIDQLTPLLMDGYLLAIEIAIERANYSEAIDRSRDILEEFSRRGMMSSASASFVFHQLAIARVANDDADSALQMLGEWADPTTLGQRQQLRFRLGVVDALLQAERFDQADTELKPVVGLLKDLRIESEEDCFLLAWAADVFSYADRMGRSLDLYQRAIAGMSERWEPTHATLVATMEDYAWQLELDDQVDEAASVMQNVVDRRAESIGANVSLTQSSIAYFAELLHESGRSSEAAKQFDRIESIDRLTDLDDEAQTNLLLTMAETYREVDRFSESVTHYLSAYDRLSFALGKYHEETLYAQHQLAYTFDKAGQPDEAMATYRQVIDGRRTTLGPVHQHTLLSTGNLLLVLLAQQRQSEAMQLIDEVMVALDQMDDSARLAIQRTIADVCRKFGELQRASEASQDVVRLTDSVLGRKHPDSWLARHQLAYLHSQLAEYEQAIELYQQVVAGRSRLLGDTHQYTRLSLGNLADVQVKAGQPSKAIESYIALLDRTERALGSNHQSTIDPRIRLANLHYEMRGYEQAIMLLQKNLEIINGTIAIAEKTPQVASSAPFRQLVVGKANLQVIVADAAVHLERWEMAMEFGTQGLDTLIAYQPNSWIRYRAMSLIGAVYLHRGASQRGRDLLDQAYEGLAEATDEMTARQSRLLRGECAKRLADSFDDGTDERKQWLSISEEFLGIDED